MKLWASVACTRAPLLSADPAYTLDRDLLEIQGSGFLEENKPLPGTA